MDPNDLRDCVERGDQRLIEPVAWQRCEVVQQGGAGIAARPLLEKWGEAMTAEELARVMPDVARHFWGEPNPRHSSKKELRWGSNGARSVDVAKGTWFDHEAKEGGGVIDFLKREGVREIPQWLKQHGFSDTDETRGNNGNPRDDDRPKRFKIVATYDYTDESGALLFQVCRLEPKSFRQRRRARPDDPPDKVKEGWVWSVKGVRQVPYRLPELLEAVALERSVVVVEGEKDVLTLARHGIPATCNAGGVHKWHPGFAEHLAGADVIIIPDNDKDGHEHAQEVARSLVGKAARIRVIELPGLTEKGDVSDWVAAGGTVEGLQRAGRPGARLDRQRHPAARRDSAANGSHPAQHRTRRPGTASRCRSATGR